MLLFLIFAIWLLISPPFHYFRREHPFATFHWIAQVFKVFTRDRMLMVILWGAIVLHFVGTRTLGQVSYNTTGFDVITHTLFGFLTREMMCAANKVSSFTDKIRGGFPKAIGRRVTVTVLAWVFCLTHEIQEQIQTVIPVLSAGVWYSWFDQIKDMIMNTIGISISRYKADRSRVASAGSLVAVVGLWACIF